MPRFGRSLTLPTCVALPRMSPPTIGQPIDKRIPGGRVIRQDHAESPGAPEPHPTNPRCLAYDVIRYALRLVLVIDVEDHGG
jgi:hypothetical protein